MDFIKLLNGLFQTMQQRQQPQQRPQQQLGQLGDMLQRPGQQFRPQMPQQQNLSVQRQRQYQQPQVNQGLTNSFGIGQAGNQYGQRQLQVQPRQQYASQWQAPQATLNPTNYGQQGYGMNLAPMDFDAQAIDPMYDNQYRAYPSIYDWR